MVINRLNGLFSSEHWISNRWQLPLVGLLITSGLVATVSALQAAAPRNPKPAPVVNAAPIAPTWQTAAPQQQEPAIDSTAVASAAQSTATAPQQQEPAVDSTSNTSMLQAIVAQQPEPAIDSTSVAPAVPQQPEPAYDSPVATSDLKVAAAQKAEKVADATSVTIPLTPVTIPSTKWNRKAQAAPKGTIAQVPASDASIPDGIYLYGKSSQPGQIGKEYLVFEAHQGKVVGAIYLPSSEYSCFSGTLDSRQMNLTVVNPYDQTAVSHKIARAQPAQIAAVGGQINLDNTYDSLTYPHAVQLDGYQPISQVSDNDKQILNSCRRNP